MIIAGDNKVQSLLSEELVPPIINITINDDLVDAMKCLNMLGKSTISLIQKIMRPSMMS